MSRMELITDIEEKIRQLMHMHDEAGEKIKQGEEEITRLQKKIEGLETELETLNRKYETLRLAKSLSGEAAGSDNARGKINNIVRELDRCIALLNQ